MTGILPDPMTDEQRAAYNEAQEISRQRYDGRLNETGLRNVAQRILGRRFLEATEPLTKMKARLMALDLDARCLHVLQDGRLQRIEVEPSPQAKQALAALDELIAAEGRRFGIVVPPLPTTPLDSECRAGDNRAT